MAKSTERTNKLSPKQFGVIAELLGGVTVGRAAEVVGVSRRQVTRWLLETAFRRELERQKCDMYQADLLKAYDTLVEQMGEDEPDEVRYGAADAMLQYDVKVKRRRRKKNTGPGFLDELRQAAADMQRAFDQQRAPDRQAAGASVTVGEELLDAESKEIGELGRLRQLSPEQLRVIVELTKGTSVVDAAMITGVSRRTITRWESEDQLFRQELEFQNEAIFGAAVQKALRTLKELMAADKPEIIVYKAAEAMLSYHIGLGFPRGHMDSSSPNIEKLRQMARDMRRDVDERKALHMDRLETADVAQIEDEQADQAGEPN